MEASELEIKKNKDLEEMVKLSQRLMDIIGEYEDTRASAMSFIKIEEALLWMQVMNTRTNYKGPGFIVKKEENKVE